MQNQRPQRVSQHNAPHAPSSCHFPSSSLPLLEAPALSQFALTPACVFPSTTRVTPSDSVAATFASTSQPYAPIAQVSRHILRPATPAPQPRVTIEPLPSPISTSRLAQQPLPLAQPEQASMTSASACEQRASPVFALRGHAPAATPSSSPFAPVHSAPQPFCGSPPVPKPLSVALSNIAPEAHIFSFPQCASLVLPPRDSATASTSSRVPFVPVHTAPQPIRALPTAPEPFPVTLSNTASAANALSSQQPAPSVFLLRTSSPISAPPLSSTALVWTQPHTGQGPLRSVSPEFEFSNTILLNFLVTG